MTQDPNLPTPELVPTSRHFLTNVSVVWIIPLLALLVSLGLAWQTYANRGEVIFVTFADGAGLAPGQSLLKYRAVTVGQVESVGFTSDLKSVRVGIRVQNEIARYIDLDAKFWIVRPQIGFNGVSGLNTVLSGVYIEGLWDDVRVGATLSSYEGLKKAPLATNAEAGKWVTLSAEDGGALIEGAPVMFRGIKVGELRNLRLDEAGSGVLIDAFVQSPFDEQLTSSTVFWDTSGFSVSLDTSGVKLNVRSLSSLIQGGVEFITILSGGTAIEDHHAYQLFADAEAARESLFSDTAAIPAKVSILLDGSVRGLKLGNDVVFRGLKVGEISNLALQAIALPNGQRKVGQRVDLSLSAEKLGLPSNASEADVIDYLDLEVQENQLRARVATTGLLGGTYIIDLSGVPEAKLAAIDRAALPFPVLPDAPAAPGDAIASAQGLMARIGSLPLEEVMTSTTALLNQLTRFVGQDETQQLPQKISGLIDDARGIVGAADTQAVPKSVLGALEQANQFFGDLNKAKTIDGIGAAMTSATEAADAVATSTKGVPALIETIDQLGQKVQRLPLEDLSKNTTALLGSINELVGSQDMAAVPKSLTEALDALSVMLRDLQQGGATASLNSTLSATEKAASQIAAATDKLPELIKHLDGVIASANGVLRDYGGDSNFNKNTQSALRQIRDTATAFEALARTIERNPQAFILGK